MTMTAMLVDQTKEADYKSIVKLIVIQLGKERVFLDIFEVGCGCVSLIRDICPIVSAPVLCTNL